MSLSFFYVLYALIAIYFILKQFTAQIVQHKIKIFVIIILIGCYTIYKNDVIIKLTPASIVTILICNIVMPIFFGWLRANSTKIWLNEDNLVVRKGTLITLVLWVLYFIIRLVFNYFIPNSEAFMLVSFGLSLLVQRELLWRRAVKHYPKQSEQQIEV